MKLRTKAEVLTFVKAAIQNRMSGGAFDAIAEFVPFDDIREQVRKGITSEDWGIVRPLTIDEASDQLYHELMVEAAARRDGAQRRLVRATERSAGLLWILGLEDLLKEELTFEEYAVRVCKALGRPLEPVGFHADLAGAGDVRVDPDPEVRPVERTAAQSLVDELDRAEANAAGQGREQVGSVSSAPQDVDVAGGPVEGASPDRDDVPGI